MSEPRVARVDELIGRAKEALRAGRPFEADRVASQALDLARRECDYQRMARVAAALSEIRRRRLEQAVEAGTGVTVVDSPRPEGSRIQPGCYLFQPPLVGADAKRFRLLAFSREIPVAVVCREPITRLGLCPLVAIGETTVRVKVAPPSDPAHPEPEWLLDAMDALSEAALETVDPGIDVEKRVAALLAILDSLPEHEPLLAALEETSLEAHRLLSDQTSDSGP